MAPEHVESRIVRLETVCFGVDGEGGLNSRMSAIEQLGASNTSAIAALNLKILVLVGVGAGITWRLLDAGLRLGAEQLAKLLH